jgi:hypothetical protein
MGRAEVRSGRARWHSKGREQTKYVHSKCGVRVHSAGVGMLSKWAGVRRGRAFEQRGGRSKGHSKGRSKWAFKVRGGEFEVGRWAGARSARHAVGVGIGT